MSQAIVEINVTPNNMVLFQKENILVSPRLETDQMLSQHSPQGYTFISKNNLNGTIKITQNGSDYEFNVDAIVKVGLSVFAPLSLIGSQEELSEAKQKKTIEIYNVLAYDIFFGCCPCGDEGSGAGSRVYQLGGLSSTSSGLGSRTTYTSFLGDLDVATSSTNVEAAFHEVVVLQKLFLWFDNSCNEDSVVTIVKNGVDTSHTLTIPANTGGYHGLEGINETFTSTDTFCVKLTIPDTAVGTIKTLVFQGSYIIVQTATSGNPFGVLEVDGEVVDNDDPSIQYPKIRVFEPITREALLAKIAASEVKIRIYRITDALHTVVSGIDFYSTIDVEGMSANEISILADNHTADKVGEYNIGTSGNDDDTFVAQGGSGGGAVNSVTGSPNLVDNSDPTNPVVNIYASVTHAAAQTLIDGDLLVAGGTYLITDADSDISTFGVASYVYLMAVSVNQLEEVGAVRIFTPKYNRAVGGYDIWTPTGSYSASDVVFWGGKAWSNNSGNVGAATDDFTLDSEWTLIDIGDTDWEDYYNVNIYLCGYDFDAEAVTWVDSGNGSKVYSNISVLALGNPIKYYQWGNDFSYSDSTGTSGGVNNSLINNINNRGNITTLSIDNGSSIDSLSMDNSIITSLSMNNSIITTLSIDNSSIDSLSMDNGSIIDSLSMDNSYIASLSMDNGSINTIDLDTVTIANLEVKNSQIDEIITNPTDNYLAHIIIYGITGTVDIDFTAYPKLLEDGVIAYILQNTSGDIVVFYQDADGGLSASEYIAPTNDEDYVQKGYVENKFRHFTLAGNQSLSTATETDITDMVVPVETNKYYYVDIILQVGCNNTGGMKIGFILPTGAKFVHGDFGRTSSSTAFTGVGRSDTASSGLINLSYAAVNSVNGFIYVKGTLLTDATAGDFIVTFASTTGGQTSTIYDLSSLKIEEYTPQ